MAIDLNRAKDYAYRAHNAVGQRRKYQDGPYTDHLDEVAEILRRHERPDEEVALGYLHDTLEDTEASRTDIENLFGIQMLTWVEELTDPPSKEPRAARKAAARSRIAVASAQSHNVKCADVISNARNIADQDAKFAAVYLPELEALVNVLSRAEPNLWAEARETVDAGLRRLATLAG